MQNWEKSRGLNIDERKCHRGRLEAGFAADSACWLNLLDTVTWAGAALAACFV